MTKKILKKTSFFLLTGIIVAIPVVASVSAKLPENNEKKFEVNQTKDDALAKKISLLIKKYQNSTDFDKLSLNEKIEIVKLKKQIIQYLGVNVFEQPAMHGVSGRTWTEWWGANLWVNLTRKETNSFIASTRRAAPITSAVSFGSKATESGASLISDVTSDDRIGALTKFVQLIAKAVGFVSSYFDYYHLSELAKQGGGVISFRFTFGFIPSGVFPGYRVVEY